MEDLIQRLRKWNKKPNSAKNKGVVDLDLASPTSPEALKSQSKPASKFQLKRPRWTSNDGLASGHKKGPITTRHSLGSSAASTTTSASNGEVKAGRPGSPFADEDDLFADRDDGVYMQSSSSSSPAASERLGSTNGVTGRPNQPPQRPASCTFGNNGFANRTFLQAQGKHRLRRQVLTMWKMSGFDITWIFSVKSISPGIEFDLLSISILFERFPRISNST